MIFRGGNLLKYENFCTVLQISTLSFLSFTLPLDEELRVQQVALWLRLCLSPQTCCSDRDQTAPGPALLPGLDLLQGRILTWGITPWGAAALCWTQPQAITAPAPPVLPDVCPAPAQQAGDRLAFLFVWQNCLLLWHNLRLGVVSQLGVNSCSFGCKPHHSPGQGRDLAELISHCLLSTTERWCLRILFPLDCCGVTNPSRQQDSGLRPAGNHLTWQEMRKKELDKLCGSVRQPRVSTRAKPVGYLLFS